MIMIKIIQNLSEKCKYNKEIMNEIVEDISIIYFYNFYEYDDLKDKYIIPLLFNIFDSLRNKFLEKSMFLSKDKKEILLKKIFEFRKKNTLKIAMDIIDDNDKDLILINKSINLSSDKQQNLNNYIVNKTEINNSVKKLYKKHKYISHNEIKEKNINIKRNKTSENLNFFQIPNEYSSTYSSNNNSLYYLISEENGTNKNNIIKNKLFKSLRILNSESSNDNTIQAIVSLYNLIYSYYSKNENLNDINIDIILDIIIKKIKILFENIEKNIKAIKYMINILYKLFLLENFIKNISSKTHEQLILLLINSSVNERLKQLYEETNKGHDKKTQNKDCYTIYKTINSIINFNMKNMDTTNNILIIFNIFRNSRTNCIELIDYSIRCLNLIISNIKQHDSLKVDLIINEIEILMNNLEIEEKDYKKEIKELIIKVLKNLFLEIAKTHKDLILFEKQYKIKNNDIKKWIDNIRNNNEHKKGFLFEGETFYPRNNENKINY